MNNKKISIGTLIQINSAFVRVVAVNGPVLKVQDEDGRTGTIDTRLREIIEA